MNLKNMISCVVGISIFGLKKYWQRVFNLMELNIIPTPKQVSRAETVNAERKTITWTIRCKKNESLPQAGNDETEKNTKTYLHGEVGCISVQGCTLKQLLSTWTKKKHPPRTINWKNESEATKTAPVSLHPALTHYHHGLTCGDFLSKGQKLPWEWGYLKLRQRSIRRCNSRGRGKLSGGRGGCGRRIIIWGGIRSKCGIKSGWWGIWGNRRWVFMRGVGISVR